MTEAAHGQNGRLRVLIVSHSYVTQDRRNKLRHLARHADVGLVTPNSFREPPFARRHAAESDGSHTVRPYRILFLNPGFSSTRYVFLTHDLGLRSFRPDVLQVENEIHSFPVLQAAACRRLYAPKARLVVSFWQNQAWDDGRGRTLKAIQRCMLPRVDFFLPANHDGDRILAEAGVDASRRAVLPPVGVDVEVFRPLELSVRCDVRRDLAIASHEFAVAYCGRLVMEKGVLDLVAAVAALRREGQAARLVIIGGGPLEHDVRQRCAEAHVPLTLRSTASTKDVARFLGACDVLVLPSRTTRTWMEQYGRVLVEAMACELPVVGSDSGEIPRVIADAGMIFPEGDVARLTTAIAAAAREPDELTRLGRAGRARVLTHYCDEAIAQASLAIYRRLCHE